LKNNFCRDDHEKKPADERVNLKNARWIQFKLRRARQSMFQHKAADNDEPAMRYAMRKWKATRTQQHPHMIIVARNAAASAFFGPQRRRAKRNRGICRTHNLVARNDVEADEPQITAKRAWHLQNFKGERPRRTRSHAPTGSSVSAMPRKRACNREPFCQR